jgi:hypothetical protein
MSGPIKCGRRQTGLERCKGRPCGVCVEAEAEFKMKSPVENSAYIRGLIGTVLVLGAIGIGAGELERLKRAGVI